MRTNTSKIAGAERMKTQKEHNDYNQIYGERDLIKQFELGKALAIAELFEAFKAGFKATGEGFNGEYCGEFGTFDGSEIELTKITKPLFDEWKAKLQSPNKSYSSTAQDILPVSRKKDLSDTNIQKAITEFKENMLMTKSNHQLGCMLECYQQVIENRIGFEKEAKQLLEIASKLK